VPVATGIRRRVPSMAKAIANANVSIYRDTSK
jgi:hypothetical protein